MNYSLNEKFASEEVSLQHHVAHFYFARRHRYARRQINRTLGLIAEFSEPIFTRALGQQGESLADAGFATTGFRITQRKVKQVDNRLWTETNHALTASLSATGCGTG